MRQAILEGDWSETEKLLSRTLFRNEKQLQYCIYQQQFFELIEKHEFQRAFNLLTKRLKPLEAHQTQPREFSDMCYMLTCRSVQDSPSFRLWDGDIVAARERLVERFDRLLDPDRLESFSSTKPVPPNRLLHLLRQSALFQVQQARHHTQQIPRVTSLLSDYQPVVVPNMATLAFLGHTANVKVARFVGDDGDFICSGGSDNTVRIWQTSTAQLLGVLVGHTSRVWDVSTSHSGSTLASASGDGSVRIWDISSIVSQQQVPNSTQAPFLFGGPTTQQQRDQHAAVLSATAAVTSSSSSISQFAPTSPPVQINTANLMPPISSSLVIPSVADATSATTSSSGQDGRRAVEIGESNSVVLSGHSGDVYAVAFQPQGHHVVSGGYDQTVRTYDIRTGTCVRTCLGHTSSVSALLFNPAGNLIVSGSKDATVRFWDVRSGVAVKVYASHLSEVTSLALSEDGVQLLTGSKDNSNRLWDVRTAKPIQRYRGHQNTSKNFVRCAFGPAEQVIVGGSEDGVVYLWDKESGSILQKLNGHTGPVFSAEWNAKQSLLCTASHDGTVQTWRYQPQI
eukprot:TRINITY_DN5305_c0_g1_i1.p1 TRINITY_DN5305_c0_g1~~TRINITY_DN5305_c0_g1_i1.p1  ORF type:complete len:658 (+),score=115.67 TRINITY_DN5305_c0_g1_i1:278-1975(+)